MLNIAWAIARPGLAVRAGLPWLVLGLFAVGLALILNAYFRSAPPAPRPRRILLACLRTAALVVLVLIILDPTLTLTSRVVEKPRVAVLVDTSRSMGFSDRVPTAEDTTAVRPRIQRAFEILWGPPRGLLESLRRRADVRLYHFAEDLSPLEQRPSPGAVKEGGGDQTNLGLALGKAVEWSGSGRPDAILLLSDGLSNVGKDPVLLASHLGVPVHAIGIGDPDPPKDVALTRCVTNEVAYVNSRVEVRIDFTATGMNVPSIPVTLCEGEDLLDSAGVAISGLGETQRVSLFFTPTEEGVHRYRVQIPAQSGEGLIENNERLLMVSVLKNKMKVHYVEAYPRWDFAFLRRTLERDANIDVVARVLKRPSDAVLPPAEEMEEMDVVILGNLPGRLLKEGEAERLSRAVTEDGKGLVVLGGRNGLDFRGTALGDVLPVEAGTGLGRHLQETFQPTLTPEGAVHMVTRLDPDPERNRKIWTDLPPLLSVNVVGRPRLGGQPLLVHPSRRLDEEPLPVLTVQRVGAGKCAVVSAYTLWRWQFLAAGFGDSPDPYGSLWGNLIRWLVSREDLKRVRVATDRHVYRSGEPVLFRAQVYDDLFRPVDGATVVATVTGIQRPGGERVHTELVLDPAGVGEGHYEGKLGFLAPGNYVVLAEAWKEGTQLGEDYVELAVDAYSLEYQRTAMAENLLKQVARASGGRYRTPDEAEDLVDEMDFEKRWVRRVREIGVSNRALLFALFACFLTAEWLLRKRAGLS